MNQYIKISEVAEKYSVSSRTLRYYEEINLLESIRSEKYAYRMYDEVNIKRLEQILLLRSMEFSLNDISKLLLSKDNTIIINIFLERVNKIKGQIEELSNFKTILNSCIKISSELGVESVNFYNLLREQIYFNTKNERLVKMVEDIIVVEIGVGLIPTVDPNQKGKVLDNVKIMRSKIEEKVGKKIPLIRIKDNEELKEFQLVIFVRGKSVYDGYLEDINEGERGEEILNQLQNVIENNLSDII